MTDPLAEWMEGAMEAGMRHTRALPPASFWERLHFRVFGVNPRSVVERRMTALAMDDMEREAYYRTHPVPGSKP